MKITKFSEIAKGPMFDHKDIMGLGESNFDDEHWVDNKEMEVKNKMDNGASNIVNKNFNFKNKMFAHEERIKNSKNDYFLRMGSEKQKTFKDINKHKNIFGDMKMGNSYANTVNNVLGKKSEKGNWLTGKTKKPKFTDSSNMLFSMKKNINAQSKMNKYLGMQNLKGGKQNQKLAMQKMIKNPFGIAKKRINSQKNLSMFGDYDGDGLANILDCNPTNKNKQAFIHDLLGGFKNPATDTARTERDVIVDSRAREEAASMRPEELQKTVAERDLEKLRSLGVAAKAGAVRVGEEIAKFGTGLATGVSNVGRGLGIIQTPEERLARDKLRLEREKALLPFKIEQAKVAALRARIEQPVTLLRTPGAAISTAQQALGATPMFASRAPYGVPQMPGVDYSISKIQQMSQLAHSSGGGFERAVRELSGSPPIDLPSSVSPAPVAGTPQQGYSQQGYSQPSYSQPSYSQPSAPTAQGTYQSGNDKIVSGVRYIRTADGRWQNTKTGDTVTYPRGSYKKSQRVVYVQQQPQ